MRHGMAMRLDLLQEAALLHDLHDQLARLETVEAVKLVPDALAHRRHFNAFEEVLVFVEVYRRLDGQDVDRRKLVALADLEVVEVVRRRDLDRAAALLRIGIFVGDDRDLPSDDRQDRHVLPTRCL